MQNAHKRLPGTFRGNMTKYAARILTDYTVNGIQIPAGTVFPIIKWGRQREPITVLLAGIAGLEDWIGQLSVGSYETVKPWEADYPQHQRTYYSEEDLKSV